MLIFVYGTLKRKERNAAFLKDANFLGEATSYTAEYSMYSLGKYPGVLSGENYLKGEVYQVSPSTAKAVDYLEGNGKLYQRYKKQFVLDKDGTVVNAWIYYFIAPNSHLYFHENNQVKEKDRILSWGSK